MSKFPIVLQRNCEQTTKLSWPNFSKVLVKWAKIFPCRVPICSPKWAEIFFPLLTSEGLNCKLNVVNAENVDLRRRGQRAARGQKCVNFDLEKLTSFST